jgi:HK97 gp10 family phage protein
MADTGFTIRGGAELEKALRELPVKLERNILRGALRAGAKVFEQEAKRRVPTRTGKLRDSIRVSVRARRGAIVAMVKAGGGKERVFYAHLVERGTAPHVILAGGGTAGGKLLAAGARLFGAKVDHPGAAARPFMRPAFDTQAAAALEAVRAYIEKRLGQVIK